MTGLDRADELAAAVEQTLRRAWTVRVRMQAAVPMMEDVAPELSGGVEYTGVVDFVSDRARLGVDAISGEVRFDGPRIYTLMEGGRWQLVEGPVGSWGVLHPRYPLEAILQARERVVALEDGRLRVELDRQRLSALSDAGVSPGWRPIAEASLGAGVVRSVRLILTGDEPDASMSTLFEYEPGDQQPAIDLPAATDTITLTDWIREHEARSEPGPG